MFTLFHACLGLSAALGLFVAKDLVALVGRLYHGEMDHRKALTKIVIRLAPLAAVGASPLITKAFNLLVAASNGNIEEAAKDAVDFLRHVNDEPDAFIGEVVDAAKSIADYVARQTKIAA